MTDDTPRSAHPLLRRPISIRWAPYVWLIYLPGVFAAPLLDRAGVAVWMSTIGAVLLFIPLYLYAYALQGRRLVERIVLLIAVVGLLLTPINGSASVFMVYAASLVGMIRPPRRAAAGVAMLLLAIAAESFVAHISSSIWIGESFFVILIAAVNAHFATVQDVEGDLRRAREEIAYLAVARERERIARDLHDVLGQTLSLITLKSSLAERLATHDPVTTEREAREIGEIARGALDEVRSAVAGFRQTGLAGELVAGRQILDAAGVFTEVETWKARLTQTEDAMLALVLREAITNVARHSGAQTCVISLREVGSARVLEVIDDGVGTSDAARIDRGLQGMRARVADLGGILTVGARDRARGLQLRAELP